MSLVVLLINPLRPDEGVLGLAVVLMCVPGVVWTSGGSRAGVLCVWLLCWGLLIVEEGMQRKRVAGRAAMQAVQHLLVSQAEANRNTSSFEQAAWLNLCTTSLWSTGLGTYLSSAIMCSLDLQLQQVPPGVARVRVKHLTLGDSPPILTGVRVMSPSHSQEVRGRGRDRLVVDLDFVFVSRQMDIQVTLRPADVQSILPEAAVAVNSGTTHYLV